jgi:hypothetical protein
MKKICLNMSLFLLGTMLYVQTLSAAPDPNFHIYLLLGQSNMEGAAPIESQDQTTHPKVQVLQDANCGTATPYAQWRSATPPLIRCGGSDFGLGPGDTFGKSMADAAGENVTIGLVGGAYGGAKIEYFLKNCAQYEACTPPWGPVLGAPNNGNSGGYLWVLELAKKAQEVGVIKGIIFHQGESNSGQSTWPTLVNEFVTDLRHDLGLVADEVPFIVGELPYTGCCSGHNSLIAQIPKVLVNAYVVTAEGGLLDKGDHLHWNSEAVREMGRRYAAKMQKVSDVR